MPAPEPEKTAKNCIRIRMYRVGLGDCFLLTSHFADQPAHVLIDCGMFAGSGPDANVSEKALQKQIVESIKAETGGHIDVVIVTHEHMDHVSIFNSAKDVFDTITFGQAWFSWVEDPTNDLAGKLRAKYEALQLALGTALTGLHSLSQANPGEYAALHQGVAQIAQFTGLEADGSFSLKAQPRAAMEYVKGKLKKGDIKYGSPGDTWEIGGLKVYVLGPPASEQQLRSMERTGATYDKALMLGLGEATDEASAISGPFAKTWGHPVFLEEGRLKVPDAYGDLETSAMLDRYNDPAQAWRRIDNMMLESAATLALQMDKYINNTSLALAFELPNKEVLLFPGDAQVGNWDSWSAIKQFSSDDLLKRTVLYKVGHHGSHNGTPIRALQKMTSPKLVAMIPTNELFAKLSKHWTMPAPILNQNLQQQTAGRLLRNDLGKAEDAQWDGLDANVQVDPLFIDYTVYCD